MNTTMNDRIIRNDRINEYFILLLFTFCSFRFYSYIGFSTRMMSAIFYVAQVLMLGYCVSTVFQGRGNTLFSVMRYILIVSWFSLIPAWAFWEQSLVLGVVATTFLSVIIVYFFMWKHDFTDKEMNAFVLMLGLIYVVLWFYSLTNLPMMTFGVRNADDTMLWNEERGMLRINFVGCTSLVLTYFLALNQTFNKKSLKWAFFAAFLFVMIVLQLTRQIIFCAGAVTLVYVFFKNKRLMAILAGGFLALYLFSVSVSFDKNGVVGSMVELTMSQTKYREHKGDARIDEYPFFFSEASKNFITDVIGNGVSYSTTPYGKAYARMNNKGNHLSDVGYASMFFYTGWIGLALYIFLFVYCLSRKVPPHLEYTLLFIGYLIIADIAADWYAKADGQIALATCVYLISKYGRSRNEIGEEEPKKSIHNLAES